MPVARKKRNFWGTTQYSARLGGTYKTDKERKRRITEQRREAILDKKLRAQEIAAEAKVRAAEKKIEKVEKVADKKIAAVEQKIDTAEKKVSKGALTESGFAAIKERMEREIEAQERYKAAAVAKYGNPIGNPAFGYGVYKPGFMGEQQVEHFSSKAAAETWARSSGLTGYKIKRAFKKNPGGSGHRPGARSIGNSEQHQSNLPSADEYRLAQSIVDRTPARLKSAYTMGTAGYANPPMGTISYEQAQHRLMKQRDALARKYNTIRLSGGDDPKLKDKMDKLADEMTRMHDTYRTGNPGGSGPQPSELSSSIGNTEQNAHTTPAQKTAIRWRNIVQTLEAEISNLEQRYREEGTRSLSAQLSKKFKSLDAVKKKYAKAYDLAEREGGLGPYPPQGKRGMVLRSARYKSKYNPEAQDDGSEEYKQAARTAELFHGRAVKEEISVTESIKEHDWYVSIGPLIKLKIRTLTKRYASLPFARKGDGRVELLCSPDGRQFYLRGGDQQLDLKPLGMGEGTEWFRDHMVIGECKEITYQDQKKFHKFAPVDYFHKLGEVTKKKPALMYDTLAGKLSIVGGQYKIEMEDLVDNMSPGIVN